MSNLTSTLRDASIKGKALRRSGFVPAVVYGKNLESSVNIQIEASALSKLLKDASLGSQVTLDVSGEEYLTMLKKISYVPMSSNVEHIDFQVLTKGEKIKTSAHIVFINKDVAAKNGIVQEKLTAIEYEVLPKFIVDHIDVDLATLTLESDIKVEDLDFAKDENISLITPANATIAMLSPEKEVVLETDEEEVAVPVIGSEE